MNPDSNHQAVRLGGIPEIYRIIFEMFLFDSGPSSPLLKAFCSQSTISLYFIAIEVLNEVNIFKGNIRLQNLAIKARICNIQIQM
jgi:hypothetical protein